MIKISFSGKACNGNIIPARKLLSIVGKKQRLKNNLSIGGLIFIKVESRNLFRDYIYTSKIMRNLVATT